MSEAIKVPAQYPSDVLQEIAVNQIAYGDNGTYQFYSRIIAPIVLTRNGAKAAAVQSSATESKVVKSANTEIKSLAKFSVRQAPKSRTALPTNKVVTARNKVSYSVLSTEQFKANCEKFNQTRYGRN